MPITTENTTVTRIKNDVNGNPRIVIGWLALLQCAAMRQWDNEKCKDGEFDARFKHNCLLSQACYACEVFVVDNTDNDCLTQHVLLQGDQSYLTEGKYKTLHACIKHEKGVSRLTLKIVEDWLRGLPTACTVEFMDYEQGILLEKCGLIGWTSDMYWRYAAKVILAYKG